MATVGRDLSTPTPNGSIGGWAVDPTPGVVPNGSETPDIQYGVDQSRGGMGGIVEVPGGAPPALHQADTNQWSLEPLPQKPGYDNATAFGNQLPDWLQPYARKITDVAMGANDTLSSALGLPVGDMDVIMRDMVGHGFLDHPGDGKAFIQSAFQRMGVSADKTKAFDQWWGDLGQQAGSQALLTMAMLAGAGPMAAAGAAAPDTLGGSVMKNVGERMLMHPGQVAAADAGATIGGQVAPLADPYLKGLGVNSNPQILSMLGNMVGGLTGAGVASMAPLRPAIPGQPNMGTFDQYGGLPRVGGRQMRATQTGPALLSTDRGFTGPGNFSTDDIALAVDGYKAKVQTWMQDKIKAITDVKTQGDPAVAAGRLRGVIEDGYGRARNIEGRMWREVDQNRPVFTGGVQFDAAQIARSAKDASVRIADIPGDIITDIMKWPKNVPIERMRQVATRAFKEASTLGLPGNSAFPSDVRRANLTKIAVTLNDAIANAYPGDQNLAKAKDFSSWLHDTFSRGPVAQFGQVRTMDSAQTSAQQALPGAMSDERFGGQLSNMGKELGIHPEVQQASEDYLRAKVNEAFTQQNNITSGINPLMDTQIAAKAAERYMNTPDFKRFSKAFPEMDKELQGHFNDLRDAVGQSEEIHRSAFFNKANTDPQTAVKTLMGSGTKVKDTQMIMNRLGGDDDALNSLKNAAIENVGSSVNWDPTLFASRLNSRDTAEVLGTLMGQQDFARMKRIVGAGMEHQNGSEVKGALSPALLAGRVIGSMLARAGGIHTIQGTSVGAKIGGSLMENVFHVIPSDKLLARALVDPKWEKFLLSKVPSNMDEIKTTNNLLGALVGTINAGHRKLMDESKANE